MKLIVMDMDGTLLTSDKKISEKTLQILIELQLKGHKLVLASGRVKARLDSFAKQLKMEQYGGYLIEANGSCIYRYQDNTRELIRKMTYEEAEEVVTYMKKTYSENEVVIMADINAYVNLAKDQKESKYFNANNMESLKNREIIQFHNVREIEEVFFKVCIFDTPEKIDQMYQNIQEGLPHYWSGRTMPFWLEVLPKEVSKGNALVKIMEELYLSKEDVYVFGDGENDISMLQVGQGIAMQNAATTVKEVCMAVTSSNDEDGIRAYLKKINL